MITVKDDSPGNVPTNYTLTLDGETFGTSMALGAKRMIMYLSKAQIDELEEAIKEAKR